VGSIAALRAAATTALAAVVVGLAAPAASAAGPDTGAAPAASFTLAGGPTRALVLRPGQATATVFTVINPTSSAEAISVAVTGLFFDGDTPQFSGAPSPGLTVTATPDEFQLAPGANHDVTLSLTAAAGARPGGLYAGVVFRDLPPATPGRTTIVAAQARPLIGHVPGPTTDSGRITGFAPLHRSQPAGPATFVVSFLDTGTIDYFVGGRLTVSSGGSILGTTTVPAQLVLPGNQRSMPVTFAHLAAGTYTGAVHLIWGTQAEHSGDASTVVSVVPPGANPAAGASANGSPAPTVLTRSRPDNWWLRILALLLLLLILAYLAWRWWRRRRLARRLAQEAAAAAIAPSATAGPATAPGRSGRPAVGAGRTSPGQRGELAGSSRGGRPGR